MSSCSNGSASSKSSISSGRCIQPDILFRSRIFSDAAPAHNERAGRSLGTRWRAGRNCPVDFQIQKKALPVLAASIAVTSLSIISRDVLRDDWEYWIRAKAATSLNPSQVETSLVQLSERWPSKRAALARVIEHSRLANRPCCISGRSSICATRLTQNPETLLWLSY